MKRTSVVVDPDLLERARRVGGERTYSATITKALEEYVRRRAFWEAYKEFEHLAHTEGVFEPDYLEEKKAKSLTARKKRISAYEVRAPRSDKTRHGSRR